VEEKCGVAYRFATNPAGVQSRQQPLPHKNTQGQLEGVQSRQQQPLHHKNTQGQLEGEGVRGGVIPEQQRQKNTQGQLEGVRGGVIPEQQRQKNTQGQLEGRVDDMCFTPCDTRKRRGN
jgi:hypothetical protein